MRTAFFVLFLLAACDKERSTDPAASATPSATVLPGVVAVGSAAAPGAGGAGAAGASIVNGDKGKRLDIDGGSLTLKNDSGTGSITQSDAGMVLKGKDGKTVTIPPIPGMK